LQVRREDVAEDAEAAQEIGMWLYKDEAKRHIP
jgi:hypothetical protein